jgi:hypothetical protein
MQPALPKVTTPVRYSRIFMIPWPLVCVSKAFTAKQVEMRMYLASQPCGHYGYFPVDASISGSYPKFTGCSLFSCYLWKSIPR